MFQNNTKNNNGRWVKVSNLGVGMQIAVPTEEALKNHDAKGRLNTQDNLGTGVLWDEIASIKHVGREQVYDIEVEGTHNFVGNEIFAHNTYLLRADPSAGTVSVGGSLGVGTTSPSAMFSLQGVAGGRDLFTIASSTGASVFSVDNIGNVGIGTDTPHHTLEVAGDVAAISFVNTSTRAMKVDINYVTASSTESSLERLMQLKVATYRYTIESQNNPLRIGLIAEDTQAIAPEILSVDGKGVDIYKLATFTLAGVQALAVKITGFETRLTSLDARVKALESGAVSSASGSPISLSTSTLASALEGFGVLIQKGIAQFNTLVFRQLVASKDADGTSSAGSVVILAGNTVAQVTNSLVLPSTKVFITFGGQVTGSWWVSDKTAGSFRVVLSASQASDVSFDYFLVQTEGQIATSTPVVQGSAPTGSVGADTTPPVITLLGDNPFYISVGATFADPGVSVDDHSPIVTYVDGIEEPNLSGIDTSGAMTHIITYRAMDSAGNVATAQRSVVVGSPDGAVSAPSGGSSSSSSTPADTVPPVVTLTGDAAMQITQGDTFSDPGATAVDDVDGSLTAKIIVTGSVDTATAGLYTLTYSATDAAGNAGSASRVVTVVSAPSAPQ